ncbi:hypothetical protein, partial [Klebsiella pneumoniae]|uniref:hypothetical protein n=1 Tax=Klebsiella pneumoniae TaxID=573 RepID=UPI001D0E6CCC
TTHDAINGFLRRAIKTGLIAMCSLDVKASTEITFTSGIQSANKIARIAIPSLLKSEVTKAKPI